MGRTKTQSNDKMARLRGLRWHRMPATEYLFNRLEALDGEAAWGLEEAAAQLKKAKRIDVSPETISRWRKKQHALRRASENMEVLQRTTLEFLTEHSEDLNNTDQIVDVQLTLMIARIHTEDGAEEAIAAIKAITALKRAFTDDRALKQRVIEHEESAAKLKAKIETLHQTLKKHGVGKEDIDALNAATVEAIDKMIEENSKK